MIDALDTSQMAVELVREVNKVTLLDEYWDIIVFYHNYGRTTAFPEFAMIQEQELWSYNAPVMATDLSTGDRLVKCYAPTKKFLYMWDLEWINGSYDIDTLASVYMDPSISLIARSKSHAKIITDCWKEPIAIIENFNYDQLTELFS